MKEYRKAKIEAKNIAIPSTILSLDKKDTLMELYREVMFFAYKYRGSSNLESLNIFRLDKEFYVKQRKLFYQNREDIVQEYKKQNSLTDEEIKMLDAIKDANFGEFFISTYDSDNAIIVDKQFNIYTAQTLAAPFTEVFNHKQSEYIAANTFLILYKGAYILDGVFDLFVVDKEIEDKLRELLNTQTKSSYE